MICQKTDTQLPLVAEAEKSAVVPVRVGRFLRLAATSDLQDKLERRRQAKRRYKAKLKSETRIDHTRPCSSFDLTDPEQVKACFHFSNQKPMRHTDNLSKGGKFTLPKISVDTLRPQE